MITHFAIIFVVTIWWYVKLWLVTKCNFSLIFFQIIFFLPFIITHLKIVTICNKSCVHRLSDKIILIVMFYVLLKKKKKMSHSMSIEGKNFINKWIEKAKCTRRLGLIHFKKSSEGTPKQRILLNGSIWICNLDLSHILNSSVIAISTRTHGTSSFSNRTIWVTINPIPFKKW